MKPIDQNNNINVQLKQFFQFAIFWGEKIKHNWNPVDHCEPDPILLKDLPKAIQDYIEIGWRFPFFEGIHFHLEWVSNDYFILDWRIGLKRNGSNWEVWNHKYDEEEKIPKKQLNASIELVILELGLSNIMCEKTITQKNASTEWIPSEPPKILSETLKESTLIYEQKIIDKQGLRGEFYLSESQWF